MGSKGMLASARERTRQTVRAELVEIAQDLFLKHGYESVSMDAIAAAAGMSRRSVFRYFPSKEELMLGQWELLKEILLSALDQVPLDVPLWTALRRAFDHLIKAMTDTAGTATQNPVEQMVFATPSLHAAYLKKFDEVQEETAQRIRDRAKAAGLPFAEGDPTPDAAVRAAFACLGAARQASTRNGGDLSYLVDVAMNNVGVMARAIPPD